MTAEPPLLIACIGVEHDLDLLPHFLAHYRALGVQPDRMRPILNAPQADAPGLEVAQAILAEWGVAWSEIWIGPYTSDAMWAKRREVQARAARPADWVLSADVDELHEYPETLPAFLAHCDRLQVNCVQGVFIDRLAPGGRLAPVRPEPALMDQFPIQADVIWSLAGKGAWHNRFGTVKLMAMRGGVLPSRGGHHPVRGQAVRHLYNQPLGEFPGIERPGYRFAVPTRVHHFHWTAALPVRLRRRLATPGVSPAGAEYGKKQLDHLDQHGGVALAQVARAESAPHPDWTRRLARMRAEGRARALWGAASAAPRSLARRLAR